MREQDARYVKKHDVHFLLGESIVRSEKLELQKKVACASICVTQEKEECAYDD